MLSAILILTILGAVCGLLLALFAKKFATAEDPRIEQIIDALPGANCGGCGYGGCAAYAKAIVKDGVDITKCAPGGQDSADQIAKIMGVTANLQERKFAVIHCAGDDRLCQKRAIYHGADTCSAINVVSNGPKACTYGCLGGGDCAAVCPTGAIIITKDNLAVVQIEKCIACGKCLKACPRHLISLESANSPYQVLCSSQDTPKQRHGYCQSSCLGCKLCTKKDPSTFEMKGLVATAKTVQNNLEQAEEAHIYCATGALININEVSPENWVTDLSHREAFKEKQARVKAAAKEARLAALAAKEAQEKASSSEAQNA